MGLLMGHAIKVGNTSQGGFDPIPGLILKNQVVRIVKMPFCNEQIWIRMFYLGDIVRVVIFV